MKFTINNVSYDTNNYLTSFVDENTGEVHPENKVLNRSVRLLWFRSVYPQARIIKETVNSGMTIDVLKAMPEYNANIPDDVFKYYERLASRGCCTAIAKASIYLDSYAKEPAVVDMLKKAFRITMKPHLMPLLTVRYVLWALSYLRK